MVEYEEERKEVDRDRSIKEKLKEKAKEKAREKGRLAKEKGIEVAKKLARGGYSGSRTGRSIKDFATRMNTLQEDTGGAFGTENRKPGFTGMKVNLRSPAKEKIDLSPKLNMLSPTDKERDLFGSSRSPEDFFGKSNKNLLGKKKKKDIKFF